MPDLEPAEAGHEPAAPGSTRRGVLRGAAGLGAAGLAAGMFAGAEALPAEAAAKQPAPGDAGVAHGEPLVVHVHDARTGVVDLYTGEHHVRVTDHQLAARLARAAG